MNYKIIGIDKGDERYAGCQMAAMQIVERLLHIVPELEPEQDKVFFKYEGGVRADFSELSPDLSNLLHSRLGK